MAAEEKPTETELITLFEDENEAITLRATAPPDRLKLFVNCQRKQGGPAVTRASLVSLLQKHLRQDQLDLSVLDDMVRQLSAGRDVVHRRVAKGIAPVHGQDGQLQLLVKKYEGLSKASAEDSDFHHRHLFDNVNAGAVIAKITPPSSGEAGRDVLGGLIEQHKGQQAVVAFDGTIAEDNSTAGKYCTLIAKQTGLLIEQDGRLQISDTLVIEGDLDLGVGDLDFNGNISVRGNVMKDFHAVAERNIEVMADVVGGYLQSRKGSIKVAGTIIGALTDETVAVADTAGNGGKHHAGRRNALADQKVSALRLHGATVEAGDDVEIMTEAMNCAVYSGGTVLMPQGQILGGNIFARRGIEASVLGSSRGSKTVLHLVPNVRFGADAAAINRSLRAHDEALNVLQMQLGAYIDDPSKAEQLPEPKRGKMKILLNRYHEIVESQQKLFEKLNASAASAVEEAPRINVLQKCYPGVEVHAEGKMMLVEKVLTGPLSIMVNPETGEIVTGPIKALRRMSAKK